MPWSLADIYVTLPAFVLVLARVSGLMIAVPFLSGGSIPRQVKAMLVIAISAAVFPLLAGQARIPVSLGMAATGILGELAIGLLVGLGVSLVMAGVQLGIQMASQQAGMSLGEVFNPMLDTSLPVVAELYFMVSIVVFLTAGGHRAVVQALLDSFETIPPLGFQMSESILAALVSLMTASFVVAIRVSGPMFLALLFGFITLGFVSRSVPQLNILTVGFPIKMMIGLFIMAMTIMSLQPILLETLNDSMDGVRECLGLASGGGR